MKMFRKKQKKKAQNIPLHKKIKLLIKNIDWEDPLHRWRLIFICLIAFLIVSVGSFSAIAVTSTKTFCNVCHEMAPENITLDASAHSEVACVDCHIGPGVVNTLVHKVGALKKVYYHIIGPPDPIVQTTPILDKNCLQCHSDNRTITASGDLIVAHEKHIREEIPCITCHSGVAHAKIVERNLNNASDIEYWVNGDTNKLVSVDYMLPNMGTCIDCHKKVNDGQKPWEDIAYSLPDSSHYKNKGKKKSDTIQVSQSANTSENQTEVLEVVNKQNNGNAKVSMECHTCHEEITIPTNHKNSDWQENHRADALKEIDSCMNCHSDFKWLKHIPEQSIACFIESEATLEKYETIEEKVEFLAERNKFCASCHEKERKN